MREIQPNPTNLSDTGDREQPIAPTSNPEPKNKKDLEERSAEPAADPIVAEPLTQDHAIRARESETSAAESESVPASARDLEHD